MNKETIIVLGLVIAAFLGGFYFSKNTGTTNSTATATPTTVQEQAATANINIDQVKA